MSPLLLVAETIRNDDRNHDIYQNNEQIYENKEA